MWDVILYEISTLEFVLVTRLLFFCVQDSENSVADAMLSSQVAEIAHTFRFEAYCSGIHVAETEHE